jgi:hypothetical protein
MVAVHPPGPLCIEGGVPGVAWGKSLLTERGIRGDRSALAPGGRSDANLLGSSGASSHHFVHGHPQPTRADALTNQPMRDCRTIYVKTLVAHSVYTVNFRCSQTQTLPGRRFAA